jgi:hypothetical protein
MNEKKFIYDFQNYGFTIVIALTYLLYALSVIGLYANAPKYINTLDTYIKIYVCLFLIIRFNPIRSWLGEKVQFTDLDRKVVFHGAALILATTFINYLVENILNNVKTGLMDSFWKRKQVVNDVYSSGF